MAAIDPTKMTATQMREAMRQLQDYQARRNAFLQSLNPTPRSPRHGRNRSPSPPTYRNPAGGAGAGNDRTDAFTDAQWAAHWANYIAATYPGANPVEPAPIPYAGVQVGEIIGYRAWWVVDTAVAHTTMERMFPDSEPEPVRGWRKVPRLSSLASDYLWSPGKIVQGDTRRVVKTYFEPFTGPKQIFGGVYAFRSPELDEDTRENIFDIQHGRYDRVLAVGTCTLWGDVVEHEHGYRASHARLRSIDAVYGRADLTELQREYGVEEQQ